MLWQWLIAAVAVASSLGIWYAFGRSLPPEIPVFYSLPWGEDQLTGSWGLLIPLGLVIGIAVLFPMIITKVKKDEVLAALIAGSGLAAEMIIVIAVLRTIIQVI